VFRYIGIAGIHDNVCRHIHRYAGLIKLLYCAGTGEARLPDLGSLVRRIGPGYGQRLYPGHRCQRWGHIPAIKERNIQAWRKIMMTECTVMVYQPSLCQVLSLTSQWRGHNPESTPYKHGESHRGQSGRKPRVAGHRHLVLLECSLCHVSQHDRCNPGHPYIRWPR
jgi:hypothetical protein